VRVVFKQLPLPFHNNAHLAAEATLAAKEQGKFWEMHAKLFANQQALDRPNLDKYAARAGPEHEEVPAALDSGKYKAKVDAELAEGNKIGANGTPAFFINGKSLSGAQPFEAFKAVDAAQADVDAMQKQKRIPAKDLRRDHEEMRSRRRRLPPAKGDEEAEDKTVYKVDPGDGPSFGQQERPSHHRRVLGLPVSVLLARGADAEEDQRDVQRQGSRRVAQLSAAVPPGCSSRCRRSSFRGQRAGQVLGDARQAV
jgi:hypothetical protein